jgi:hypothetical protein
LERIAQLDEEVRKLKAEKEELGQVSMNIIKVLHFVFRFSRV